MFQIALAALGKWLVWKSPPFTFQKFQWNHIQLSVVFQVENINNKCVSQLWVVCAGWTILSMNDLDIGVWIALWIIIVFDLIIRQIFAFNAKCIAMACGCNCWILGRYLLRVDIFLVHNIIRLLFWSFGELGFGVKITFRVWYRCLDICVDTCF